MNCKERSSVTPDRFLRGGDAECEPDICAFGPEPHQHCVCGLPMTDDAAFTCGLCELEGLEPKAGRPSFRRRRVGDPEWCIGLVASIVRPSLLPEKGAGR